MKNKKLIIFIVIAVVAVIIFMQVKKMNAAKINANNNTSNTTANGLFGYLGEVWSQTTGTGSANLSEGEAKEISKKIADLKETESDANILQANNLITELSTKGWSYIGYNQVQAINP